MTNEGNNNIQEDIEIIHKGILSDNVNNFFFIILFILILLFKGYKFEINCCN